jgi:hypothetical protein
MKKLIFFLFGYLSLLNVLQSQPVDINLSKEDRAFNDKIVEDAVAIVLGDVVDTLFSEGTEDRSYATTHFLVRIKHIYRGHSLITSDLIEIETPGGIYYDAKALQGIEPPYGGVDVVGGENSVDGIEKIIQLSTDVTLFINKKNDKRWFKTSSEAFSLNYSSRHRRIKLSLITKTDHISDYALEEKEQYLKKVQYSGLDFLHFNSHDELQNYLASFKDIKMPDDYGKKPSAAVVSFGGTSSNPLVTLRMAFDTLLLTTDNKIITEDAQGKEYLEFDISVRKSPGTSANTYLNRLTVNFVFDTLLFGTYLLGNQRIAFSPAADAATCFDTYQIRTGNFITYDVAYNRVAAELNIDPAGEPYSRLCMTDTWQSAIHVRLQIKTCGQTSGIQFQTGTSATWTPAADTPLSAGATVYDSGVLATNPPFRLASPASICAVGDTTLRLSTNSIVSGIGKKLVLYPTTNVKFGTAKGKITVTDANNVTNSDESKRTYNLDMIDYQWYNDSIVIRSFPSSSLTGKSPGTGIVRVKSADGTKNWSSEGKLHVLYSIYNPRIPNSTERVRPVLANVSCMKGLKFYVDASMLRRKGYLNETLTDTLGSFPAIRRALSDWSAYFYKTTGLSLNWTLEPGFHTESSITDGVLIKYDSTNTGAMETVWKTIDSSYTNLEVGTGSKRPQYFVRKVVIKIGKPATYSFNLPGSQITGRGNFYHDILHEIGHCFGLGHIVPLKDLGYNELDLMWWESDLQSWEADAWFNHIEPSGAATQSKIGAREQVLASARTSFINSSTVLKSRNQRKVASIRLNTTGNTLPTAGQITITRTANTTPITSITLGAVDSAFIIVRPDKRPNGFTYRWYVKPPNQTEWYPIRHYGTFLDCRDSSNVRFTMRTTWGNKNICWNGFQFKAGITDGCTEVFSPVLTVSQPCTVPLGINFQNAPYNICFGTNGFNQFYAELNTADAIGQEIQVFVAVNGSITNGYSISPPVLVTANISSILCTVPNIGQPAGNYSLVIINYHTLQKMNTVDGLLKIKRPSKGLSCPTFSSTLSKDMDEPHTLEQDVVRLYPNPARTELFVEVSERLYGASILMFDVQGRKIAEVKDATYQQKLDTSTLPSGLYFVQIRHEHFLKTEKVFILQE